MLDVGRNERKALLHTFYHDLDKQKLASIMADDFKMSEEGGSKTYSKQGVFTSTASDVHGTPQTWAVHSLTACRCKHARDDTC
jgi:hypothetical protein